MNNTSNIVPVFLGADLNAYGFARAFHEEYGVKSYVFGKYPLGATSHSSILTFTKADDLSSDEATVARLVAFAAAHEGCELYLFGCTDEYAEMIIRNRKVLSEYYFCPCTDEKTAEMLESKERFYEICDKYSIPHPLTLVFDRDSDFSVLNGGMGFDYPIIIKPSRSSLYWKHPFPNMKKVYSAETPSEAHDILDAIFGSGYDDTVIVQDTIPGDDSGMFVLTSYSGTDGKVKKMALGHVLLEEHTPKGLGNHVAVITENHDSITEVLKNFLNDIGYVGFSNFDIKYDTRDGTFKVFEINLRQGRSNYYVTGCGQNLARTAVDDRHGLLTETEICKKATLWYTVPKRIIYKYVKDTNLVRRAKRILSTSGARSTLRYKPDLKNPMRLFYVVAHEIRYFAKYRKYPKR